MTEDGLLLARAQFGLNIAFHILFPTLTIALGWYLVGFRLKWLRSGERMWEQAYRFWTKVFALSFAMGVVSGITMSFQFGTNWPGYMNSVGNIAGPLLAYEVLTAFFLEATFLGVMLFGINRVPAWLHVLSTCLVAVGTTVSAFWILALNSWMQTPAGHARVDGALIAADWWAVIFAAVLAPLQMLAGDQHGLNTLEHQPAKIAAMEALWKTERGMPLVLFAIPNTVQKRNDFAIEVPKLGSFVLRHDFDAEVKGLNEFEPDTPPVAPLFFAFRAMVGIGVLMLLLSWTGAWFSRGGRLMPRWLLWGFAGFTFAGWAATLCGWVVTEIGRQPWLVTGVLRTADAVGKVADAKLGASLTGYLAVYAGMLLAYIVVLTHLAGKGADA